MINKKNWEETKKRYVEYWNRENHDRPLISVKAPKESCKYIKVPERIDDCFLDPEYVISAGRASLESTYFGGEAYPILWPNLGPDIFGAFYGLDLKFAPGTSWAIHRFAEYDNLHFIEDSWYKKIKEMTKAMLTDSKGDYFVGITDLHTGTDGLASITGPQKLCIDMIDNPDSVKKGVDILFEGFKKVVNETYEMSLNYQTGSTNWLGVWHPGKWYVTSCDFSCMISNNMFKEFVLPELLNEIKHLDASIYHLDGPGALKHIDSLLDIAELKGIQWVYGAGQPSAKHWIPILKKIQNKGKLIHVSVTPDDITPLIENLRPEGVMFELWCSSEQEANDILKYVEKHYHK